MFIAYATRTMGKEAPRRVNRFREIIAAAEERKARQVSAPAPVPLKKRELAAAWRTEREVERRRVQREASKRRELPMPDWAASIVREVAGRHELAPHALLPKCAVVRLVKARDEAMYRIYATNRKHLSLTLVGRWFSGRDHTTVIAAIARFSRDTGAPPITTHISRPTKAHPLDQRPPLPATRICT